MTDPLRDVVESNLRVCVSFMMRTRPRYHHWILKLSCGHEVDRPCKRKKGEPGERIPKGYAAIHHPRSVDSILPAPKKVRCDYCGRAAESQGGEQAGYALGAIEDAVDRDQGERCDG